MRNDVISEIGIDKEQRLYIKPLNEVFPFIYREAMEVCWDDNKRVLLSPKPREWSYENWYVQIMSATIRQGVVLTLSERTIWQNIPENLRASFKNCRIPRS